MPNAEFEAAAAAFDQKELASSVRRSPPSRRTSTSRNTWRGSTRGFAEEPRLLVRIGVHLGEIIIHAAGHDIFGDGFNLAERIKVLTELGGIVVLRAVRDVAALRDAHA